MRTAGLLLFAFFSATLLNIDGAKLNAQEKMKYPPANKVGVVDEYFGFKVPDEYRWLEDDVRESEEVAEWVTNQNNVTMGYSRKPSLPRRDRSAAKEALGLRKIWHPLQSGWTLLLHKERWASESECRLSNGIA